MHRRPFEGRHLVTIWEHFYLLNPWMKIYHNDKYSATNGLLKLPPSTWIIFIPRHTIDSVTTFRSISSQFPWQDFTCFVFESRVSLFYSLISREGMEELHSILSTSWCIIMLASAFLSQYQLLTHYWLVKNFAESANIFVTFSGHPARQVYSFFFFRSTVFVLCIVLSHVLQRRGRCH